MSSIAIKVENLGKKYLIRHEKQEQYKTFQEVLTGGGKKIITLLNPFHKGTASQDETVEELWAPKDINFEISKSEAVAVIGRNSAGGLGLLKVDFQRPPFKTKKIKMLRVYGQSKRYHHKYIGVGGRMDTFQATVLNVKLRHYDQDLKKRQEIAEKYSEALTASKSQIITPVVEANRTSAWAQYTLRVENRDEVQAKLKEAGIPTAVHYPVPLHLQECFGYLGRRRGDFPIAEMIAVEAVSLPTNPYLSGEEIVYICNRI